jgi:Uma2 family endonuclease
MTQTPIQPVGNRGDEVIKGFPDHTQLPDRDGNFAKNFQELPQSVLLTDSLTNYLVERHPEGDYAIGQDCGIYWRETDPPERGAEAPDWFYVPGVPAKLNGQIRRSYVIWREFVPPTIVLEFASGDGSEERDTTPYRGKQWVYEKVIRPAYYGIFSITTGQLEMFHMVDFQAQPMAADAQGRYFLPLLGIAIGVWSGSYQNQEARWLRWWNPDGTLCLTGHEQVDQERLRTEQEKQRTEQEKQRADAAQLKADEAQLKAERLAAKLQALGIDPEAD